jgi:hypothetical protein
MCLIYDCASNITLTQGTAVGRIADVCFAYPWWMALLPIAIATVGLYILCNYAYDKKWGNDGDVK